MKFKILTDESKNLKLSKSAGDKYYTVGISLAPHSLSGRNVCPAAGECKKYCIGEYAGNVVIFPNILQARIRKTKLFFEDRAEFMRQLRHDLTRAREYARSMGKQLCCRLNTFSDLAWETLEPSLFAEFADVQFYDYTKIRARMERFVCGKFPANYHLSYSLSERTPPGFANMTLASGGTVVAAIDISIRSSAELPDLFDVDGIARPVVDGDKNDLRFLDLPGRVVLLRAKGNLLTAENNFVQSVK